MEIKFKTDDAKELIVKLKDEEIQVLVEYALVSFIRQGIISLSEDDIDTSYLSNMNTDHMGQA